MAGGLFIDNHPAGPARAGPHKILPIYKKYYLYGCSVILVISCAGAILTIVPKFIVATKSGVDFFIFNFST
jgi:hypothetical protein